jgi:hypothetical protein
MKTSWVTRKLEQAGPLSFSAYCITAAFSVYFCMYAFRKPFTAGTFDDVSLWGVGFKTILVSSQVFGYTLSKFIGIKVISEMTAGRRAIGILVLIGLAHLSLLLFGLVPPPFNFVCLFLNGLPLGMVFGLVLSFLEGRRLTEALAAGLCASFIVASGCVKSVGRYLIVATDVSEYWMPFLTGLIFVGPLVLFVWMLNQIPPPRPEDIEHRAPREPMSATERRQFFATHALGLSLLILTYIVLTIMRSIRDDFAVEIWRDLGEAGKPAIFAQSETLVMLGVVVINGAAILIRDNRRAFRLAFSIVVSGFMIVCLSIFAFSKQWLPGFAFMVLTGFGMYIPYVAFHTTIFERLIAVFRNKANIGYLMYLADATGYLGYVAVMLVRNISGGPIDYLGFFLQASTVMALASMLLMIGSLVYFRRKMGDASEVSVVTSP